MNNEIKEMAEAIFCAGVALDGSDFASKSDHFERLAKILYQEAGYRKQNDTVKEFADRLACELGKLEHSYKKDRNGVICSKWSREWIEADTIDGFPCGSSGWDFYPVLEIMGNRELKVKGSSGYIYRDPDGLKLFYDLIQAGMVEVCDE